MSRIKEMTREVVREGEDRRATFTAQGTPLRIYKWWHRHTKRQVTKENFCHYCRVVAIWAPLMFIRMLLARIFGDRQFWICMALAIAAVLIGTGIAFPGEVGVVLFWIVAACAAIVGFIVGIALSDYVKDKSEFDDMSKRLKIITAAVALVTIPAVVFGFTVGIIWNGLTGKAARRFYRWLGDARLVKGRVSPASLLLWAAAGAVVALSIVGNWWIVPLVVAVLVMIVVAGRWAAERLGFYLAQQRLDRRVSAENVARQRSLAALEPILRMIFDHLHPEHSEEEYWDWHRQYVERTERRKSKGIWSDIYNYASPYYFPDWDDWNEELFTSVEDRLTALHQERWQSQRQSEQKREALVKRVSSPFTATGDFVILLAQFIRVSKWKICPVVELPKDL